MGGEVRQGCRQAKRQDRTQTLAKIVLQIHLKGVALKRRSAGGWQGAGNSHTPPALCALCPHCARIVPALCPPYADPMPTLRTHSVCPPRAPFACAGDQRSPPAPTLPPPRVHIVPTLCVPLVCLVQVISVSHLHLAPTLHPVQMTGTARLPQPCDNLAHPSSAHPAHLQVFTAAHIVCPPCALCR